MAVKKKEKQLKKLERFESFYKKWYYDRLVGFKRIEKMIKHLSDDDLAEWFRIFFIWERKFTRKQNIRGIETSSLIFKSLYQFFKLNGVENYDKIKNEIFLEECFEWRGYIIKLYIGQGSFFSVLKDGKILF